MFADVPHVKNAANLLKKEFAAVARRKQASVFVRNKKGGRRNGKKRNEQGGIAMFAGTVFGNGGSLIAGDNTKRKPVFKVEKSQSFAEKSHCLPYKKSVKYSYISTHLP